MPAATGSALSFHRKDNARVGDTGRIYFLDIGAAGNMMRMYRGISSHMYLRRAWHKTNELAYVYNPPHTKGETMSIIRVNGGRLSVPEPARRLSSRTIE